MVKMPGENIEKNYDKHGKRIKQYTSFFLKLGPYGKRLDEEGVKIVGTEISQIRQIKDFYMYRIALLLIPISSAVVQLEFG